MGLMEILISLLGIGIWLIIPGLLIAILAIVLKILKKNS